MIRFKNSFSFFPFLHDDDDDAQALFAVTGLQLLQEDPFNNSSSPRHKIVDWIYLLQKVQQDGKHSYYAGFETGNPVSIPQTTEDDNALRATPSIASTFAALALLKVLEDNFSRVDRPGISNFIRKCQNNDGSFSSFATRSEQDLRFTFSGVAVCYILNDLEAINVEKAISHILSCQVRRRRGTRVYNAMLCINMVYIAWLYMGVSLQTFEGGFGISPGCEAHGGSTFCAVASLKMIEDMTSEASSNSTLRSLSPSKRTRLIHWLFSRQVGEPTGGYNGRTNKPPDTCYSFWVGATIELLGMTGLVNEELIRKWILSCQDHRRGKCLVG